MALSSRATLQAEYEEGRALDEETRPSSSERWDDSQPQDNRARRVAALCAQSFEEEYDAQLAAEYARDEAELVAKDRAALAARVAAATEQKAKDTLRVIEGSEHARRADSLAIREKFAQRMKARELRGLTNMKLRAATARHEREFKRRARAEAKQASDVVAEMTAEWRNWVPHGFAADGLVVGSTNAANEHAPTIAEKLEADLWDTRPSARSAALSGLVSLRRDVALLYVPHLVERLVDPDASVRAVAVEGLVALELAHDAIVAPRAHGLGHDPDAVHARWNPNRWMLGPLKLEERMKARQRRNFGARGEALPGPMVGDLGTPLLHRAAVAGDAAAAGDDGAASCDAKYQLSDLLQRRIADENVRVRLAALRALQILGSRFPTPAITPAALATSDRAAAVVAAATEEGAGAALAASAAVAIARRHAAHIVRCLDDDELSVQQESLSVLVSLGPAAHSQFGREVVARIGSPISSVAAAAVEALKRVAQQQTRFAPALWESDYHELIAAQFTHPVWSARRSALRLLLVFSESKCGADGGGRSGGVAGGAAAGSGKGSLGGSGARAAKVLEAEQEAETGNDVQGAEPQTRARGREEADDRSAPELSRFASDVVALLDDGDYRVRLAAAEVVCAAGASVARAFAPLVAHRLRAKARAASAEQSALDDWRSTQADLSILSALGRPSATRYADDVAPLLEHVTYEVRVATVEALRVAAPAVATRYGNRIALALAKPPRPHLEGGDPTIPVYPFG